MDKINKEAGKEVAPVDAAPILHRDLLWVWAGFQILHRGRPVLYTGNDLIDQTILLSEMTSYCELQGISDARSLQLFCRFIIAMDDVYIRHHAAILHKRAAARQRDDAKAAAKTR